MVVAACICGYTKTTDFRISIKLLKKITVVYFEMHKKTDKALLNHCKQQSSVNHQYFQKLIKIFSKKFKKN